MRAREISKNLAESIDDDLGMAPRTLSPEWQQLRDYPRIILGMPKATDAMKHYALKKLTQDQQWDAVMLLTDKPSEDLQRKAIAIRPGLIGDIENPSEEIQLMAVSQQPTVIYDITNPSDAVLRTAVERDPFLIMHDPRFKTIPQKEMDKIIAIRYKNKTLRPGQRFHRMLQSVQANPGGNRSDWFVHSLGLAGAGMPAFDSEQAADGFAALLGCITARDPGKKPSTYQLRITDRGRRVLAKLDAGLKLTVADVMAL